MLELNIFVIEGCYLSLLDNCGTASTAPKWFNDVVKSIVNKYDLDKEVTQSSLAEGPVY